MLEIRQYGARLRAIDREHGRIYWLSESDIIPLGSPRHALGSPSNHEPWINQCLEDFKRENQRRPVAYMNFLRTVEPAGDRAYVLKTDAGEHQMPVAPHITYYDSFCNHMWVQFYAIPEDKLMLGDGPPDTTKIDMDHEDAIEEDRLRQVS